MRKKKSIAILTRPDFRSPRVLAESLKIELEERNVFVEIFDDISVLNSLVSFKDSKLSLHFWVKRKIVNFLKNRKRLNKLKAFDAVVISECIPNAFIKRIYNVERFKKIIKKPIGLYEVYYLGNAPTQIDFLKKQGEAELDRYDFHLSIADTTEIKQTAFGNYFPIGIRGQSLNLKPSPKKELLAILDFVYPGNEEIRNNQIIVLNKLGIKYIALEGTYSFEEIRSIYQQGSIYFMQSFEAFGLPLLECICSGCQIFAQESWWPMSWRLNENPTVHGDGIYPDCFTIYNSEEVLINELIAFKANFNLVETPQKVFNNFLQHYPQFYLGNDTEIQKFMHSIDAKL